MTSNVLPAHLTHRSLSRSTFGRTVRPEAAIWAVVHAIVRVCEIASVSVCEPTTLRKSQHIRDHAASHGADVAYTVPTVVAVVGAWKHRGTHNGGTNKMLEVLLGLISWWHGRLIIV